MRLRNLLLAAVALLLLLSATYAFQRPWREYQAFEYSNFPVPPDYQEKTEWVFARLMYPSTFGNRFGDWREGRSHWTMDYPRSDRHFSEALRRLTRIHVRSVEQPVMLEDGDEVFRYPFLYGVEVGHWALTDEEIGKFREYLLRGGFFMCDDFHGTYEWEVFNASMQKVFPDRPIVEIDNSDQIFHMLYDLDDRYQVPGAQYLRSGQEWEYDGKVPHWRGIYDDKNRLMVAICHNMDLGDSWEHADNPDYPEKFSELGIRIGVNYVVYAMTH